MPSSQKLWLTLSRSDEVIGQPQLGEPPEPQNTAYEHLGKLPGLNGIVFPGQTRRILF